MGQLLLEVGELRGFFSAGAATIDAAEALTLGFFETSLFMISMSRTEAIYL